MNSQRLNDLHDLKDAFETIRNKMALSTDEKITIDLLRIDVAEQIAQAQEEHHTILN